MFKLFHKQKVQDKDEAVLTQLTKHGSDLSKPHSIDFFLYFPKKEIAEQGKMMIQERFANSSAIVRGSDKSFLCKVNISMAPDSDVLENISLQLEAIAASLDGEYDGWETGIVK